MKHNQSDRLMLDPAQGVLRKTKNQGGRFEKNGKVNHSSNAKNLVSTKPKPGLVDDTMQPIGGAKHDHAYDKMLSKLDGRRRKLDKHHAKKVVARVQNNFVTRVPGLETPFGMVSYTDFNSLMTDEIISLRRRDKLQPSFSPLPLLRYIDVTECEHLVSSGAPHNMRYVSHHICPRCSGFEDWRENMMEVFEQMGLIVSRAVCLYDNDFSGVLFALHTGIVKFQFPSVSDDDSYRVFSTGECKCGFTVLSPDMTCPVCINMAVPRYRMTICAMVVKCLNTSLTRHRECSLNFSAFRSEIESMKYRPPPDVLGMLGESIVDLLPEYVSKYEFLGPLVEQSIQREDRKSVV